MASSGDVELLSAADDTNSTSAPREDPSSDTGEDEEPPEDITGGLSTEALSSPTDLPHDLNRDTRDEDETSEPKTGDHPITSQPGTDAPDSDSDSNSTVTESGELRIVTTLKGLTTGCALFLDDRPSGSTPCSQQLPEGRHTVRVERQGHKPVERAVIVKANQVTLVRLELQPAK